MSSEMWAKAVAMAETIECLGTEFLSDTEVALLENKELKNVVDDLVLNHCDLAHYEGHKSERLTS